MQHKKESEYIVAAVVKYNAVWEKVYEALHLKEIELFEDKFVKETVSKISSSYITMLDEEYPENLKRVPFPPFALFYYGDISLLKKFDVSLAVIGNRHYSEYGEKMTRKIVKGVSKKLIIVSGMALGIDSIAADECLKNGGKTIAVLGSGIDYCYPSSNKWLYDLIKEKGLIVSEYPNDLAPLEGNFPRRNRIIAGLSRNILITEARVHSGTSITAHYALGTSDILCVPKRADEDSLCNKLIKLGAKLVTSTNDVLEEYERAINDAEFEL